MHIYYRHCVSRYYYYHYYISYVNLGVIHDPLVINVNHAYEPYTSIDESVLLTGFQDYKTFNAPDGAPWKSRTNLS